MMTLNARIDRRIWINLKNFPQCSTQSRGGGKGHIINRVNSNDLFLYIRDHQCVKHIVESTSILSV